MIDRSTGRRRLAAWLAVSLLASAAPASAAPASVAPASVAPASSSGSAPVALRDDWGRRVVVATDRPRIVSLAPHATELLADAGALAQLVAVDPHSDHPAAVSLLPRLAALPAPDAESLLALAPGLVVVWGAGLDARWLRRLEAIAPTFVSDPQRLDDVATTLERFALVSARPGAARAAARHVRERLRSLRERFADRPAVTVFYQVWERPLITVSNRGVIGDAMRACGAVNVFSSAPTAAPAIDAEAVLVAAPRLLIVSDGESAARERWRRLGLWRDGVERIVTIDAALLQRPTTRMLDAVDTLCRVVETARR